MSEESGPTLEGCAEAQAARVAAKEDARVREALGLVP